MKLAAAQFLQKEVRCPKEREDVIFMIVIPTMVHGVPVQLPIAKGEPVPEALRQTVITVKDDATIYIDNLVIRREQFAAEIRRIHTAFPQKPSPCAAIGTFHTAKS